MLCCGDYFNLASCSLRELDSAYLYGERAGLCSLCAGSARQRDDLSAARHAAQLGHGQHGSAQEVICKHNNSLWSPHQLNLERFLMRNNGQKTKIGFFAEDQTRIFFFFALFLFLGGGKELILTKFEVNEMSFGTSVTITSLDQLWLLRTRFEMCPSQKGGGSLTGQLHAECGLGLSLRNWRCKQRERRPFGKGYYSKGYPDTRYGTHRCRKSSITAQKAALAFQEQSPIEWPQRDYCNLLGSGFTLTKGLGLTLSLFCL